MGFFGRRNQDTDPTPTGEGQATPPDEDQTKPQSSEAKATEAKTHDRNFDTALGAGSVLEGTLTSDGNVRLDGKFTGTLNIEGNVLVGVTAQITADIEAQNISVAGLVEGDLNGNKVHLLSTAQVRGDIRAESLITEDGATIAGHVRMGENTDPDMTHPASPNNFELADEGDETP